MKTIRLREGKERSALRSHPWIFDSAIAKGGADSGETVRVESHSGSFLGWAAFSPSSKIRARIWSFDEAQRIDAAFFEMSVKRAIAARSRFDIQSNGLRLISGGTDNHLVLVDVTSFGIGGKVAEKALEHCGVTVNMNMIPFDTRKPMDPSGIRIGSPALTTRGMGADEFRRIGQWIATALKSYEDATTLSRIRNEIRELTNHFPVPASGLATVGAEN